MQLLSRDESSAMEAKPQLTQQIETVLRLQPNRAFSLDDLAKEFPRIKKSRLQNALIPALDSGVVVYRDKRYLITPKPHDSRDWTLPSAN